MVKKSGIKSVIMGIKNRIYQLLILLAGILLSACKKDKPDNMPTGTRMQLTLDSVYLYAKQTYLWNDALPTYEQFNPRSYTSKSTDKENFEKELFDITQYSINAETMLAYEYAVLPGIPKYSSIQPANAETGLHAAVFYEGNGNDYGFNFTDFSNNDIRIAYVIPGSPAALAGIKRGARIVSVNQTDIDRSNVSILNNAMNLPVMSIKLQQADKAMATYTLTKKSYLGGSVYKSIVLTTDTKKAGYIALAYFGPLKKTQADIDTAFARFADAAVTELVIDLRYNGGGYIETAEYVANHIASGSMDGKVMFTEQFNTLLRSGKADILKNQVYLDGNGKQVVNNGRKATMADIDFSESANTHKFSKKGNLQTIKNVYFIVSTNTASASELLINSLQPYFNVKLIGEATYGKPVGFFGIRIDSYTLYLSNFVIKNAVGNSNYFNGMPVDVHVQDDVTHDFGDTEETCLNAALAIINNQKPVSILAAGKRINAANKAALHRLTNRPGMIEQRFKLKQ
jgi:carboxyl-terminal processing protease